MKALARKFVPKPLWLKLARAKARVIDAFQGGGERDPDDLVPPRHLMFVGDGDFKKVGNEFLGHFREFGGLKPHHAVLDVGSGIGRMAVPLTRYLTQGGSYQGIDIVPHGVEWCRDNITPRFPHFQFGLADVRNPYYNAMGNTTSVDYRFPFADEQFDFVFMTSVFTHMQPPEVANYLKETARVLKPGGRSLITWFLLNDETKRYIAEGKSELDFRHPHGECLTDDPAVPESAIAYPEETAANLYRAAGLEIELPIGRGSWCGRKDFVSFQDIVIGRKPA